MKKKKSRVTPFQQRKQECRLVVRERLKKYINGGEIISAANLKKTIVLYDQDPTIENQMFFYFFFIFLINACLCHMV